MLFQQLEPFARNVDVTLQRGGHGLSGCVAETTNKTIALVFGEGMFQRLVIIFVREQITPDEAVMLKEVVFGYFDDSQCSDVLGACPLKFRHLGADQEELKRIRKSDNKEFVLGRITQETSKKKYIAYIYHRFPALVS